MEFLDYLAAFLSCPYLSDLRKCRITYEQADALRALPIHMFDEAGYFEAVRYLTGETPAPDDVFLAKETALRALGAEAWFGGEQWKQNAP